MELRVLKYFLAVAREENISKAAEFVHTTQPNLSRQMQSLEDEIGQPLFIRGSRKITLTAAGILLRKRAEEIVSLAAKTAEELTPSDDNIGGTVAIGCGESHVMRIIAGVCRTLSREWPEIKFQFFSGDALTVTEKLDNGLLDFGVLINYDDFSKYDYIRLPLTDTWGVLLRKDDPLADLKIVTAQDLSGRKLIYPHQPQQERQHPVNNWFEQAGVTPDIAATYNLIYNASLLVEAGLGPAVGLDRLLTTDGDSPFCFRPFSPRLESHLDIAWKKYQVRPRASEIFLDELKKSLERQTR